MKKLIVIFLTALLPVFALSGCGKNAVNYEGTTYVPTNSQGQLSSAETTQASTTQAQPVFTPDHTVKITVKNYGVITIDLDSKHAPITVANFLKLAKSGFYDGLTFHRIIAGFMIQGGASIGGNPAENIKGEFEQNGVDNPLLHTRGAISMARSGEFDSANSQFFIVQQDSPHLNKGYAAFGYVTSGIDIVDKICANTPVVPNSDGMVLEQDQPVIESIKVVK